MTSFNEAADAYAFNELKHARPLEEWHEDMGPKLWWKLEEVRTSNGELKGHEWAGEPPYVGSPLDAGFEVMMHIETSMHTVSGQQGKELAYEVSRMVGGWPGYHTHFTDIVMPEVPK